MTHTDTQLRRVHLWISPKTIEQLRAVADGKDRTFSAQLRIALRDWLWGV
jgi:hypothetical protein